MPKPVMHTCRDTMGDGRHKKTATWLTQAQYGERVRIAVSVRVRIRF